MEAQEKDGLQHVPYIVYEAAEARGERTIKRLLLALIISIVLAFVSNLAWLYVWMQYDTISYSQDGEGINSVNLGTQGDLLNGAEGENQTEEGRKE